MSVKCQHRTLIVLCQCGREMVVSVKPNQMTTRKEPTQNVETVQTKTDGDAVIKSVNGLRLQVTGWRSSTDVQEKCTSRGLSCDDFPIPITSALYANRSRGKYARK